MNDTKPWWQSQTIWGSLVAIAAVIASFFGINLDNRRRTLCCPSLPRP